MKILILGAGKMGSSLLTAINNSAIKNKLTIEVVEPNKQINENLKKKFKKFIFLFEIPNKWRGDILFLAIKPQIFKRLSNNINSKLLDYKITISIMAGIKISSIRSLLHNKSKVLRAMPNLPASKMIGVTCLYGKDKFTVREINTFNKIFKTMGKVFWLKREKEMNAVTAISGSGPAYFFFFIMHMLEIAKKIGISKEYAPDLVYETAKGAILMAKENSNFNYLIKSVSSKGGTTEAALKVLKNEKDILPKLLTKAISAAKTRSEKISDQYNYE